MSGREPLRWSEKAFIRHLFLLASAGDLGGSTYDTIVIPLWEGNHGLYWHPRKKNKKHGWPRRTPGFQSKHPLNFISHYISNLITWWNVTPAGVLGCWGRAWWEDPVHSQRGRSASLLPLEGSVNLGAPPRPAPASLRRKPRPPFINGSSWAAAMSCQAALRQSSVLGAHAGSRGGRPGQYHIPEWPKDQAHTLKKTGPSIHSDSLREWN